YLTVEPSDNVSSSDSFPESVCGILKSSGGVGSGRGESFTLIVISPFTRRLKRRESERRNPSMSIGVLCLRTPRVTIVPDGLKSIRAGTALHSMGTSLDSLSPAFKAVKDR